RLHVRGGGKVGATNGGQGDGRRVRRSRRRPDGRQKWPRRNCYVVILKDPRAAAAGGSAHDPRSPPRIQGEHDDPRESRNRRPDGIGAQACVGSTEYADICGYISSGNSVIEQDVVHRDVRQRVCARAADVLPGSATVGGAKDVAERVPETGESRI